MSLLNNAIRRLIISSGSGGSAPVPGTYSKWSSPSTWVPGSTDPNDLPQNGENLMISVNSTILLDVDVNVGSVVCFGKVIIPNDRDTLLDYHSWVWMDGSHLIFADGTDGNYLKKFTTRPRGDITGSTPRMVSAPYQAAVQMGFNNSGFDRSMVFEDGSEVHGGPPATDHHWRLGDHASIGQNSIKLRNADGTPVNIVAKQGETFVISTTDYFGQSDNEVMTVASNSVGDTVTFNETFTKFHWGKLQYITQTGPRTARLSLVDEGWRHPQDPTYPYFKDQTAHVIRTTRPITVDGSMDGNKGGRVMIHGIRGAKNFRGWLQSDMGVKGHQQWYGGFHHHMSSYEMPDGMNSPSNGNYVGGTLESSLCVGHFIRDCAVVRSKNRGMVPHGANGVTYDKCVFFDVLGSSIFGEEGAQQLCVVNECHSIKNRPPAAGDILQKFDGLDAATGLAGCAAFWWTNPNNTLTNNSATDVYTGFWNAFTWKNTAGVDGFGCWGLSKNIRISPSNLNILKWANNEVGSFRFKGVITAHSQSDETGNTADDGYAPPGFVPVMEGMRFWKGTFGGYFNRVNEVKYLQPSASDVCGTVFNGAAGDNAEIIGGLFMVDSLNATARPSGSPRYDAMGVTYHGGGVFPYSTIVNYSLSGVNRNNENGTNGQDKLDGRGAFKMWSEYLFPVTYWVRRTPGMLLFNSDFGYRTPPQILEGEAPYNVPLQDQIQPDFHRGVLSTAVLMTFPYLGGAPNQWWTYDTPFFTYGAANLSDPLVVGSMTPTIAGTSNGKLTTTRFFGFQTPTYDGLNYEYEDAGWALDMRRLDPTTLQEVGHFTIPGGIGNKTLLPHFRHVALMEGGVFKYVPFQMPQNYLFVPIWGARETDGKSITLCLPFTGTKTARVSATTSIDGYDLVANSFYVSTFGIADGISRRYTMASSLNDLLSGAPNRFWQDKANNQVWLKFTGGMPFPRSDPNQPYYTSPTTELYDQARAYVAISAEP